MVTIRQLLYARPDLHCTIFAGASGLDREIRTISSIESRESISMLKGGELILATAFLYENKPEKLGFFVRDLILQGIIGLGVKTRYIKNIPENVIDLANANDFPVFSLPPDMVWSELITPFHELRITSAGNEGIFNTAPAAFEKLLDSSNWSFQMAQKNFVDIIRICAAIVDDKYKICAMNAQPGCDQVMRYISNIIYKEEHELESYSYQSVKSEKYWITDLVLRKNEHLVLASERNMLYRSEIELLQILYNNISRHGNLKKDRPSQIKQFINGIVDDMPTIEVEEVAKYLDLSDKSDYFMLLIEGESNIATYDALGRALREQEDFINPRLYYAEHTTKNEIVVLCNLIVNKEAKSPLLKRLRELVPKVAALSLGSSLFIGDPVQSIGDIRQSYVQAVATQKIARLLWDDCTFLFYRDVDALDVLDKSHIGYSEISFLNAGVTSFDACKTLEMFLEHNSIKKAANAVYVHENTMRYRIQRLSQFLCMDLSSPINRLNLLLKIKLWRMNQPCQRPKEHPDLPHSG